MSVSQPPSQSGTHCSLKASPVVPFRWFKRDRFRPFIYDTRTRISKYSTAGTDAEHRQDATTCNGHDQQPSWNDFHVPAGLEKRKSSNPEEQRASRETGYPVEPAQSEVDAACASRRAWLLTATGGLSGGFTAASQPRKAEAFPSKSLESLQESPSTSSSRAGQETGLTALRNPAIYRGQATEKAVRKVYNLDGLLPGSRFGLQREVDRAKMWIDEACTPLQKYQALMTLKETNRDCFFAVLAQNLTKYLPIVYTPTVGKACQEWSHLLHRPTGLYISINDLGNVKRLVKNWPEEEAKIAVITDGERILGLGDLGANGLGIPVGKAIVHSVAGGIHPRFILPIVLDVGCNNPKVRDDAFYLGVRQDRVRGSKYDALVEELLTVLRKRYGHSLLVHWEDFAANNSYRLLARARSKGVSTFNDDIESTAAAVVAAVLGATRVKGVPALKKQSFLLLGAGQANIGSARLLTRALQAEGLSASEAKSRIWLFDSKGIVFTGRKEGSITPEKAEFCRSEAEGKALLGSQLADVVQSIKPTSIIGAAARSGLFSEEVIGNLRRGIEDSFGFDSRPIVLALSNPDSVAECTAQEAYEWSGGRALYASGTAFPAIQREGGEQVVPSQANNSLIFPGVGLGCIASGATLVTEDMMLAAARAVARKLTKQEISQESILPDTERLREVALSVAAAVVIYAVENKLASSTGFDVLSCLPSSKSLDREEVLKQTEACIAKLRYDAFANEQLVPNPVNPILL